MIGNELTENFIKDKFPESEASAPEKVLDIHEFEELIDDYKLAQIDENMPKRVAARAALKDAYRAALRAAGKSDR